MTSSNQRQCATRPTRRFVFPIAAGSVLLGFLLTHTVTRPAVGDLGDSLQLHTEYALSPTSPSSVNQNQYELTFTATPYIGDLPAPDGQTVVFDDPDASGHLVIQPTTATTVGGQASTRVRFNGNGGNDAVRARWMAGGVVRAERTAGIVPISPACMTEKPTMTPGYIPFPNPQDITWRSLGWGSQGPSLFQTRIGTSLMDWQASGRVAFREDPGARILFQDVFVDDGMNNYYGQAVPGVGANWTIQLNLYYLAGNPRREGAESAYPPLGINQMVRSTIAHEVGHALGLEHTGILSFGNLMYSNEYNRFGCGVEGPTPMEFLGLADIY